ncbi:MAG: type II toxin-antitoxin system HicB family antitoxin [Bryobacterales bacterium]|nr:type II toxin-antitoxin system HicB family antitoxin [Bryobacterales bacterium]
MAIEYYREQDGRWLTGIAALPGVTAYGRTSLVSSTLTAKGTAMRLGAARLVRRGTEDQSPVSFD